MKRYHLFLVCVLVLVAACSQQKTGAPPPEATAPPATATPRPTRVPATQTPVPTATATRTATPTKTPWPSATPTLTRTPAPTPTRYQRPTATPTTAPTETPVPSGPGASGGGGASVSLPPATPTPLLEVLEATDPGPPFAITVSANRALEGSVALVSGWVRNESDETYEAIGVQATFTDGEGFYWGPLDTRCPCTLLAPGESCPFIIEASMRRPTAVLLQPQGRPSKRESTPVILSGVRSAADGSDSIRVTGTASNAQPYKIKNPIVIGMLIDQYGQMVSLGYTYVTVEDIEPGAGVPFDLRVTRRPYAEVQTYAQAERDWQ